MPLVIVSGIFPLHSTISSSIWLSSAKQSSKTQKTPSNREATLPDDEKLGRIQRLANLRSLTKL